MTRPSAHRRGYTRSWNAIVAEAIARQPWCNLCGATEDLDGDHEIPLSRGGRSNEANVQVLCRSCNSAKRDREPVYIGLTLSDELDRIFGARDPGDAA
jgi:5-methylcytosine-specific restriction endonuclease McrA